VNTIKFLNKASKIVLIISGIVILISFILMFFNPYSLYFSIYALIWGVFPASLVLISTWIYKKIKNTTKELPKN
jgi:hypothetical protein